MIAQYGTVLTCTVCGKTTDRSLNRHARFHMEKHVESLHVEGVTYNCTRCDKISRSKVALQKHTQKFHNRQYCCLFKKYNIKSQFIKQTKLSSIVIFYGLNKFSQPHMETTSIIIYFCQNTALFSRLYTKLKKCCKWSKEICDQNYCLQQIPGNYLLLIKGLCL